MPTDGEFIENTISTISSSHELFSSSRLQLAKLPLSECTDAVAQHLRSIGRLPQLEALDLVPAACQVEIPALRTLSGLSPLRSLRLLAPRRCEDKDVPLHLESLATIRHNPILVCCFCPYALLTTLNNIQKSCRVEEFQILQLHSQKNKSSDSS